MLQHLVKWAVFAAAWRQAKPYLTGTVVVVLALFLINTLHAEFVDYIRLSRDLEPNVDPATTGPGRWLLASFVIKWALYVGLVVAWGFYARRVFLRKAAKPAKADKSVAKRSTAADEKKATPELTAAEHAQQLKDDQAFDFLRGKRKLQGRGDKILQGNQATPPGGDDRKRHD